MKIPSCKYRIQTGFTLIELMISVAVLSIITAIALPSFRENIKQGRRLEARSLLLENAQFMERFFTENNRYNLRVDGSTAVTLPILASPRTGQSLYVISFDTVAPLNTDSFNIRAVPVAGGAMDGDACGTYLLSNLGVRANLNNIKSSYDCWKS
jgi:type IV pilus assembly protein PilE